MKHDCPSDSAEIAVSSLRTAWTEAERAENYVECVRSVAGGVYFVMQINARLPNHPLLHPCMTTATPWLCSLSLSLSPRTGVHVYLCKTCTAHGDV